MFKRLIASLVCVTFICSNLQYVQAQDFSINQLPLPGKMIGTTPAYVPLTLKGLIIHPENAFKFDFLMDTGRSGLKGSDLSDEAMKIMKYFLTALTIPEDDLWVNLSPYERGRIVQDSFGQTLMGRDLLAEDYVLKQLTASLIYPEKALGKEFWQQVYSKAAKEYGTTLIPVNTFNKVWIVPSEAVVWEHEDKVLIVKSHLKVMLEEDYLSLNKHVGVVNPPLFYKEGARGSSKNINELGSQIVRQIVLPVLEKEVNEGKNFAQLRQMYQAMVLATWYKKALKESILTKIYADKKKVIGIGYENSPPLVGGAREGGTNDVELIYQQYLKAFKMGTFNYIKDDIDPSTGQATPRKYFSGGFSLRTGLTSLATALLVWGSVLTIDQQQAIAQASQPRGEMLLVQAQAQPTSTVEDLKSQDVNVVLRAIGDIEKSGNKDAIELLIGKLGDGRGYTIMDTAHRAEWYPIIIRKTEETLKQLGASKEQMFTGYVMALSSESFKARENALEKIVGFGAIDNSSFIEAGPNGERMLDILIDKEILRHYYWTQVSLGPITTLDYDKIWAILERAKVSKDEFDKIWPLLQQSYLWNKRTIEPLLGQLVHGEFYYHGEVLEDLDELGPTKEQWFKGFSAALSSPDPNARAYAVSGLGSLRDPRAIPLLRKMFQDKNPDTQIVIKYALEAAGANWWKQKSDSEQWWLIIGFIAAAVSVGTIATGTILDKLGFFNYGGSISNSDNDHPPGPGHWEDEYEQGYGGGAGYLGRRWVPDEDRNKKTDSAMLGPLSLSTFLALPVSKIKLEPVVLQVETPTQQTHDAAMSQNVDEIAKQMEEKEHPKAGSPDYSEYNRLSDLLYARNDPRGYFYYSGTKVKGFWGMVKHSRPPMTLNADEIAKQMEQAEMDADGHAGAFYYTQYNRLSDMLHALDDPRGNSRYEYEKIGEHYETQLNDNTGGMLEDRGYVKRRRDSAMLQIQTHQTMKNKATLAKSTDHLGGIALNAKMLDLQIKRNGNGVPLPISQQPLDKINIQGFVPQIISIQPVDLPTLLGLNSQKNPELLAKI